MTKADKEFNKWLEGKPEIVRQTALEFPPGTKFCMPDGSEMWVVGYREPDGVIASTVNPITDYDGAMKKETQSIAHASCIRSSIVRKLN